MILFNAMKEVAFLQKGITVRHEEEIVNLFMGLAAMNGTTGTDILRRSMEDYIEKNRGAGAEKLSGKAKGDK